MEFLPILARAAAAALFIWLGIRRRRKAFADFADDCKRFSAVTTMRVVSMEKTVADRWEEQEDGSRILYQDTVYLPTYEYTVNGTVYQYHSNHSFSTDDYIGREYPGYYDPTNPRCITEDRPRKPVLGGFLFFLLAAVLLFAALRLLVQTLYYYF